MQSFARGRKVPKVPPKIKGRGGAKGNFGGGLWRGCTQFTPVEALPSAEQEGKRKLKVRLNDSTFSLFGGFWGQTAPTADEGNISERSLAEKASDTSLPVHSGSAEETPQTPTSVSHLFFPFCRCEGSGGVNPLIGCRLPAALTALSPNIRGAASRKLASLSHPAPTR